MSLFLLCPTLFFLFFFTDTATTEIYTLSLHDALPIFRPGAGATPEDRGEQEVPHLLGRADAPRQDREAARQAVLRAGGGRTRGGAQARRRDDCRTRRGPCSRAGARGRAGPEGLTLRRGGARVRSSPRGSAALAAEQGEQ